LKEKYGDETLMNFLKSNDKNVKKTTTQKSFEQTVVKSEKSQKAADKKSKKIRADEDTDEEEIGETKAPKDKSDILKQNSKTNKKKSKPSQAFQKSEDSFFIDSNGQNYLASVQTSSEDDSDDEPVTKKVKITKKTQKQSKPAKTNLKKPVKAEEPIKVDEKLSAPLKTKTPTKPETSGELHPSWQAKAQMRKAQIQDFQGTKIKFDD
jgi:hypothetical protein